MVGGYRAAPFEFGAVGHEIDGYARMGLGGATNSS
jgi:hypothetical protein